MFHPASRTIFCLGPYFNLSQVKNFSLHKREPMVGGEGKFSLPIQLFCLTLICQVKNFSLPKREPMVGGEGKIFLTDPTFCVTAKVK